MLGVEREGAHLHAYLGRPVAHRVVETADDDAPLLVVEGGEDAREGHGGIDHGPAVAPRVQVLRGTLHVHLEVREAAER